ncbi:hypothetical protein [Altererythrobacter sp. ZODW24]|uniref:hypothetical protein n=1 Tax=Altererythrobacter sp. ZODW24 TaxID=2185142 RepID=UPI000DF7F78E|nr:hypothetical protein [Altererythrobacter sp. ZODW24]
MRKFSALLAFLSLAITSPALADEQLDADRETLALLQLADARLHTIGWSLATGNAPFCDVAQPSVGLLLQDMAAFKNADRMRAAANVVTDIAVQAVAAESPAAKLGLSANMSIFVLDGVDVRTLPAPEVGYERLAQLNGLSDAALQRDGYVNITWRESPFGAVTGESIFGVPACTGRFEMLTNSKRASADGQRVLIGMEFPGLAYADDEFAAAVAHEFAHNLLGHRAMLDAKPRQISTRASEREADRMMPWLLANAGYDPAAALRFMQRWGPKHGGGIFRARSHDGWDERAENIAAELPLIAASIERNGSADWSKDFVR